jgi:hypothetical protein
MIPQPDMSHYVTQTTNLYPNFHVPATGTTQQASFTPFLNPPIGSAELAALMLSAWRAESGPSHLIKRSNSSAGVTLSSPITALNVCFQDRYCNCVNFLLK